MSANDELVESTLDVACADLGLPPPPVAVRLKLLQTPRGWTVYAHAPDAAAAEVAEWLGSFEPGHVTFGARRPGILRADVATLPFPLAWLTLDIAVRFLVLSPNGDATVRVEGGRGTVQAIVERFRRASARVIVRSVVPPRHEEASLTRLQHDALAVAFAAGYYAIPRRLNLTKLARRLGMSPAALSERLRRAEAHVVSDYFDALPGGTPDSTRVPVAARSEGPAPGPPADRVVKGSAMTHLEREGR